MLGLKLIAEISANLQRLPNHFQQEQKATCNLCAALWQTAFGAIIALPVISHLLHVCKGQRAVEDTYR